MHARTTQLQFVDSTNATAIRAWKTTMELSRLELGFIEAILLVRPENHQAISISVWDTKEHCEATGRAGPGTLIEKAVPILRPFLKADPIFTQFEVRSRLK